MYKQVRIADTASIVGAVGIASTDGQPTSIADAVLKMCWLYKHVQLV